MLIGRTAQQDQCDLERLLVGRAVGPAPGDRADHLEKLDALFASLQHRLSRGSDRRSRDRSLQGIGVIGSGVD
jgi:hypothetical protein